MTIPLERSETGLLVFHALVGNVRTLAIIDTGEDPTHPELHGFLTSYRLPASVQGPKWRKALWERFRIEAPIVVK